MSTQTTQSNATFEELVNDAISEIYAGEDAVAADTGVSLDSYKLGGDMCTSVNQIFDFTNEFGLKHLRQVIDAVRFYFANRPAFNTDEAKAEIAALPSMTLIPRGDGAQNVCWKLVVFMQLMSEHVKLTSLT